jgi:hypothetical protein
VVCLAGFPNSRRVDVGQQLLCARHQQMEVHPAEVWFGWKPLCWVMQQCDGSGVAMEW